MDDTVAAARQMACRQAEVVLIAVAIVTLFNAKMDDMVAANCVPAISPHAIEAVVDVEPVAVVAFFSDSLVLDAITAGRPRTI